MPEKRKLTVLIVDDEPDMLKSLGRIFRAKGLIVEVANSGEEAVEKAQALNLDAIVMDIKMPGISGLEAYLRIRGFRAKLYVVLMTGFSEIMDEAAQTDGVEVLIKPVDPNQLCEMINSKSEGVC
jgi:CheY-like chemotaxis protein